MKIVDVSEATEIDDDGVFHGVRLILHDPWSLDEYVVMMEPVLAYTTARRIFDVVWLLWPEEKRRLRNTGIAVALALFGVGVAVGWWL